jgi:hypothetical protein
MSSDLTPNDVTPRSVDCDKDPIAGLKAMFVDVVQRGRMARGQCPVQRPVFLKAHGVARATLSILRDLPEGLRIGVFAEEKSFDAWVRFSSDTVPSQPDLKTTVGFAIKLFGINGEKLLPDEPHAPTHDFILQNHDVFFVDDAREMCRFTQASLAGNDAVYKKEHPITQQILHEMEKEVQSVLTTSYWSVLPYRFGDKMHVKYKLAPIDPPEPGDAEGISTAGATYLHEDLKRRLSSCSASFRFLIQLQTDPETMPLDRATIRWDEKASPPVPIATLTIHRQDIDARGQANYGENLAFHPWNVLDEHAPVGSIAEARKIVYSASSHLRRDANGIPTGEPAEARPLTELPASRDTRVVRAAIHPSIGIARVGNSQDVFFIGPEVIAPEPPSNGFRDGTGALKRQAAQFRIFGYNAGGEAVAELTADNAQIQWTVHVANKKAAWYQFQIAMDIPEAKLATDPTAVNPNGTPVVAPFLRRNAALEGKDRSKLVIDPGPRTISGRDKEGAEYCFDTGMFFDTPVYLGELRTDKDGRLVFLGGRGVSTGYKGAKLTTFANNDWWHDDTSDGPVTATVSINGQAIPVDSAWVVTAPPNYAPAVIGVRSMYDLMWSVQVESGHLPTPEKVSFREHIQPILERLSNLQWVNRGFAAHFGWGGPLRFDEPKFLQRLSNKPVGSNSTDIALRRQIANMFRTPDRDGPSWSEWPWLYGDAIDVPNSPRWHLTLSPIELRLLARWASGDFEDDYSPGWKPPQRLNQVKLAEQPAMLDRAALTFCLADAFHPGCEMTWPMRHPTIYSAPYRVRHGTAGVPELDYGAALRVEDVLAIDGPLYGQRPGDLTRWMAVPWQSDTASCLAGYDPSYDPSLPTFWPARVPNHVLTFENYQLAVDSKEIAETRLQAFRTRAEFFRNLVGNNYLEKLAYMVNHFDRVGVVERQPGLPDDAIVPPVVFVESLPTTETPERELPATAPASEFRFKVRPWHQTR